MFKFEDLRIYQESLQFIDKVYSLTAVFPKEEIFGLSNQFRRAAVSITLNIAEGTSRTQKDFRHFLTISRGSCYECVALSTISYNRKYINRENLTSMYEKCNKMVRMIKALKSSLL